MANKGVALIVRNFWTGLAAFMALSLGLSVPSVAATIAAIAKKMQPHRAVYALTVETIGRNSALADAGGAIYYEFRESCTGWKVRHRFRLEIVRLEKPAFVTDTEFKSEESKDGRHFTFETKTRTNGQISEKLKGSATLDAPGKSGAAKLDQAKAKVHILPAGTMFPTWHTLMILAEAETGRKVMWATIYDGSEKDRHSGINVLFGRRYTNPPSYTASGATELLKARGWQIGISYFGIKKNDAKASYKLQMRLNENGVTTQMRLDYGDFVLRADLKAIERLPKPKC